MTVMDRPRHSRGRRKGGGGRPPGRRPPPPANTGLEAAYLTVAQEEEEPLVVVLEDGKKVSGVVNGFDRDLLMLEAESGEVLIRKSEIKYVYEVSEEK